MASAFKKFKQLENQKEPNSPILNEKPARKQKLQTYNHIVSKFETLDGDERKRIVQERLKQRQIEKEAKLEEERRRKLEEEERRKRQLEEEERLRKLREEEEERLRQEEELRKAQEEEARRKAEEKSKHENRFSGLKPAAAMFEKALEAKRSVQKSIKGERVITLRKGTISEIRSKIFDNQPQEEPIIRKSKSAPKKIIIEDNNKNSDNKTNGENIKNEKGEAKLTQEIDVKQSEAEDKKLNSTVSDKLEPPKKIEDSKQPEMDGKNSKRQSFISDFAALEKTYKILGMNVSKEPNKIEETTTTKKRHNSEGKVKNKDKAKRRSAAVNEEKKAPEPPTPEIQTEPVINALDKGRAAQKKNFFQTLINEKKGAVKKESELMGPQMRKKTNFTQSFEVGNDEDTKRKSFIKDDIKVDKKQFNAFLDKFETKDQRAEAKNKMVKLTKQQKEFEKRKQMLENQQLLEAEKLRREEEERLKKEEEEREIQLAMEAEMKLMQQREEEEERLRVLEEEKKASIVVPTKKKVVRRKKKVEESQDPKDVPKLNLAVTNYSDVKNVFEKKKTKGDEATAPQKSLRINKIANNPFLEATNSATEEKPQKQEVKVNKLQKMPS